MWALGEGGTEEASADAGCLPEETAPLSPRCPVSWVFGPPWLPSGDLAQDSLTSCVCVFARA